MPERLRHHIERSRNNPYEWALCIALLILSLYGAAYSPPSSSLDEGLTRLMRYAYSFIGIFGGLATIIGLRLKDAHLGLLVEQVGQLAVSGGALTFAIVLCRVSTFNQSGLVTMSAFAIFAGAAGRTWQIGRDLRREKRILQTAADIQETLRILNMKGRQP